MTKNEHLMDELYIKWLRKLPATGAYRLFKRDKHVIWDKKGKGE
ncbi:MAG TPA: hypothetical protein VNM45_03245 [Bacillus sp. (in: firmicutes)]|nr:hypothetical protein [Bacillus sp. (in: firmicutes)]